MGQKDKIKRAKKADDAMAEAPAVVLDEFDFEETSDAKAKVDAAKVTCARLAAKYQHLGNQIGSLRRNGFFIKYHPDRKEGTLVNIMSTDDFKMDNLLEHQAKMKGLLTKNADKIVDYHTEILKKFNDDMDKKDPPAGGMGGSGLTA